MQEHDNDVQEALMQKKEKTSTNRRLTRKIVKRGLATSNDKQQEATFENSLRQQLDALLATIHAQNEQHAQLSKENALVVQQKDALMLEHNNLLIEFLSLKKEKDESGKKIKRRWNSKGIQDEKSTLQLIDKEQLAASEVILKNQLHDLEVTVHAQTGEKANLMKQNSFLAKSNESLLQEREDLVVEITLLKKEKDEFSRKLEKELNQENSAISKDLSSVLIEKYCRGVSKVSLPQQLDEILTKTHRKLANLHEENSILTQTSHALAQERDDLVVELSVLKEKEKRPAKRLERELRAEIESIENDLSSALEDKDRTVAFELSLKHELDEIVAMVQARDYEQQVTLSEENLLLVQLKDSIAQKHDNLLAQVALLKRKLEVFAQNEEEQKRELESIKNKLSTAMMDFVIACKEKECIFASEMSLKEQFDKLEAIVQSKDEQLESMKKESTSSMQAKECLAQERANLVAEVAKLKEENEALTKQLEGDSRTKIVSTKKELSNGSSSLEQIADLEVSLRQQLDELAATMHARDDQLENMSSKRNLLFQEKDSLFHEHSNLVSKFTLLKEEKDALTQLLEGGLGIEILSLKKELSTMLSSKEQVATSEVSLRQQLQELEATQYVQDEQLEKLDIEHKILGQAKNSLVQERDYYVAQVSLFKKENEAFSKRLEGQFETEITSIKNKLSIVLSDKERIAASEILLTQQLHELKETLHVRDGRIENLIKENCLLVQEKEDLTQECDIVVANFTLLKEEKDSLFQHLEGDLRAEMISIKNELSIVLGSNERLVASEVSLKQQLDKLNSKIYKQNEEQVELQKEKNQLVRTKESLMQELNITMEEVSTLKKEKEVDVNCQVVLVKEELDNALKDKEKSCEFVNSLCKELELVNAKVKELNDHQVELAKENDHLVQEKASLKEQCDILYAEIVELKQKSANKLSVELKEKERMMATEASLKQKIAAHETFIRSLTEQQVLLTKEQKLIVQDNEALTKERDTLLASVSSLKKQYEAVLAKEMKDKDWVANSEACLKHNFDELVKTVNKLNKKQENHAMEKKLITQAKESLAQEHDKLLATVSLLEGGQTSPSSNGEHHPEIEEDQSVIVKESKTPCLEASFRQKLDEVALTVVSLTEQLAASTRGNDQMVSEMKSLKQECTKLHMALSSIEREKVGLTKRLADARTISDRLVAEVARLQREVGESEKRLAHAIADRDNVRSHVAEMQLLLNNQQRMHQNQHALHLLEKLEALEVENRCLRREKVFPICNPLTIL